MKRKKTKQERKTKGGINVAATILPLIDEDTYKKMRGRRRLHKIKDTFISE